MKKYLDKTALANFAQKLTDKYKTFFAGKSLETDVAALQAAVGSPLVAATAAGMTDTTKIYVYTGSETGYTAGNWYFYNGSAWISGGVYNSFALQTDTTLSVAGEAADAAAAGTKIGQLSDFIQLNYYDTSLWELGAIDSRNGNNSSSSSTRMRTKTYYSGNGYKVGVNNGYKYVLFAYNKNTNAYIGNWNGTSYQTSGASWQTGVIDFADLGDYKFRFVLAKENDGNLSVSSDSQNFLFYANTDPRLTQSGKAADAKATGDAIAALESEIAELRTLINS